MRIAMHWQILIAIVLAIGAGFIANQQAIWLGINSIAVFDFLGTLFMNGLLMVIVPLVMSSIISGMASMGSSKDMGRMLGKTLGFYVITSALAIMVGVVVANIMQPGIIDGVPATQQMQMETSAELEQSLSSVGEADSSDLLQVFVRMIPTNVVQSAANGDMLALIFFSMLFGFFMTKVGQDKHQTLLTFWAAVQDVMLEMTMFIMRFAPLGVFGLVAKTISATGLGVFLNMAWFFAAVTIALLIHLFISMSLILRINKISPSQHLQTMRDTLLMAFSTSSSAATIPISMAALEQNAKVNPRTTSFVIPLGATINMNGTALYECVAAIFIAQAYGLDLSLATQFTIVTLALLTSIGVAAVPAASLVAIMIILTAVGLPLEGIGLLLVTDRVLDMMRTAVNVYGDSVAAVVIAKSEGEPVYQA